MYIHSSLDGSGSRGELLHLSRVEVGVSSLRPSDTIHQCGEEHAADQNYVKSAAMPVNSTHRDRGRTKVRLTGRVPGTLRKERHDDWLIRMQYNVVDSWQ